jgi:transcriptional regulator with XRE-family HTH domain
MGRAKRMERHAPKRLGEKLLQIREAFGDSQAAFLERLGNPEAITQKSISDYERGQREPPLLILLCYARLVGINTDNLVDDNIELDLSENTQI